MRPVFLFVYLLVQLAGASALAQNRIGEAVDAQTRVVRSGAGGQQIVATATPVFQNDLLQANATGLAQIRLLDDSRIVVGPNSSVTLDDFVFSGSRTARTVSVSVTKGAFRWISGRSGSSAYSIKTPAGTVGVRGTAVDITILGAITNVLLLKGEIIVCPELVSCFPVTQRCDFVAFTRSGKVDDANLLRQANTRQYESTFPLIGNQPQLNRRFRRETAGCKSSQAANDSGFVPSPAPTPAAAPYSPPDDDDDDKDDDVDIDARALRSLGIAGALNGPALGGFNNGGGFGGGGFAGGGIGFGGR